MKKYIYFEVEEIEKLLEIAEGEVNRYENIMKTLANEGRTTIGHNFMCTKWEARRDTIKEILEYGFPQRKEIPE